VPLLTNGFLTDDLLEEHFDKHVIRKKDFPHITTELEYLEEADTFCGGVLGANTQEHIRSYDGAKLRYNKKTNVFGIVDSNGFIRTYYKPSGGERYFRSVCL
jgi:pyocin large subunit-like protein